MWCEAKERQGRRRVGKWNVVVLLLIFSSNLAATTRAPTGHIEIDSSSLSPILLEYRGGNVSSSPLPPAPTGHGGGVEDKVVTGVMVLVLMLMLNVVTCWCMCYYRQKAIRAARSDIEGGDGGRHNLALKMENRAENRDHEGGVMENRADNKDHEGGVMENRAENRDHEGGVMENRAENRDHLAGGPEEEEPTYAAWKEDYQQNAVGRHDSENSLYEPFSAGTGLVLPHHSGR